MLVLLASRFPVLLTEKMEDHSPLRRARSQARFDNMSFSGKRQLKWAELS